MTTGVTATWVPHRRNLIEAIKERPKPASTNQNRNSVEKSTSSTKKNGSGSGASTNGEIGSELPQTQPRDSQPTDVRNVTKQRVEKNQPTTNDNRDTNNNSEKNPKPKPKPNKEENVARGRCHFEPGFQGLTRPSHVGTILKDHLKLGYLKAYFRYGP